MVAPSRPNRSHSSVCDKGSPSAPATIAKKALSRVSAGESALHEALRQLPLIEIPTPRTMHELFETYMKSATGMQLGKAKLAPSTKKQYVDMIDRFLARRGTSWLQTKNPPSASTDPLVPRFLIWAGTVLEARRLRTR